MKTKAKKTRILIADDHELVRRGIRSLLEADGSFDIVAECASGRDAVAQAQKQKPHIAVLDVAMPTLNGIEATRQIHEFAPEVKVVILSVQDAAQTVCDAVSAGASGYVLKSDTETELLSALKAIASGGQYYTTRIAYAASYAEPPERRPRLRGRPRTGVLSAREREVIQLIAEGMTSLQAGHHLGLSVKTVETHRARFMRKLKLRTVSDIVRYAIRNGFITA